LSRNKDRLGQRSSPTGGNPAGSPTLGGSDGPLIFETPSGFVDLPTRGVFYPPDHPLHNKEQVEIKHMTAKEEDILASKALLKKGVAIDRFLQSVIKNRNIDVNDLYVGDRNAILIAARITGYGEDYTTQITCPNCMSVTKFSFDLSEQTLSEGALAEDADIKVTENGTLMLSLPVLKVDVELRMLTGKSESYLTRLAISKKGKDKVDSSLTDMLKTVIVSVSGRTDSTTIESLVNHLPARDSQYIRHTYSKAVPNVSLRQKFECSSCSLEDEMEVPLNAEFFWPKQ